MSHKIRFISYYSISSSFKYILIEKSIFFSLLSALIIADLPYGYGVATWDTALTTVDLDRMMTAIRTVSSTSSSDQRSTSIPMTGKCIVIWHSHYQISDIDGALIRAGWEKRVVCVWHKTGQNANGNLDDYVNAWECCTVAWHGDKKKGNVHFSTNPLERQNVWMMPSVNSHTKIPGTNIDINFCEKPPQFAKQFCEWFTAPNDDVLVLGFGSGSDLIGCLEGRRNVVGVELDAAQFGAVKARLNTYIEKRRQEKRRLIEFSVT